MTTLTAFGVVQRDRSINLRDGLLYVRRHHRMFNDVISIGLSAQEKRHLARLLTESAANAEYERRTVSCDRDLPAVGSFGG